MEEESSDSTEMFIAIVSEELCDAILVQDTGRSYSVEANCTVNVYQDETESIKSESAEDSHVEVIGDGKTIQANEVQDMCKTSDVTERNESYKKDEIDCDAILVQDTGKSDSIEANCTVNIYHDETEDSQDETEDGQDETESIEFECAADSQMEVIGDGKSTQANEVQGMCKTSDVTERNESYKKDDIDLNNKENTPSPTSSADEPVPSSTKQPSEEADDVQSASSGASSFPCTYCDKVFPHKSRLSGHMLSHTKPYKCKECGKGFSQMRHLNSHSAVHKKPICSVCKKSCTDIASHMKSHEAVQCSICNKSFAKYYNLKKHMLIHSGERTQQCHLCSKTFIARSDLNRHLKIHAGEKNYECQVCLKKFIDKGALNDHMKKHTGLKPYLCSVCNKSFARTSQLKAHKLIHDGVKPFECVLCSKAFTQQNHLQNHMTVHTRERPHMCHVCGKAFSRAHTLVSHIAASHKKDGECKEDTQSEGITK